MTIRTKLIGVLGLIALLVPVLGGLSIIRLRSVAQASAATEQQVLPGVLAAKEANTLQRSQQEAVLAYFAGGRTADRERYGALVAEMDGTLADLRRGVGALSGADAPAAAALVAQLEQERHRFATTAGQLLEARDAIQRDVETVRVKAEEIVIELTILRTRFNANPSAASSAPPQPLALQAAVSQLLFGVEGMMSDVGFEAALSAGYALSLNPIMRQRFNDASGAFPNFLRPAKEAAGPLDRPTLDRVEIKFYQEFEPAARRLMATADEAATARQAFADASSTISTQLEELVGLQSGLLTRAQHNTHDAVHSSERTLVGSSVLAFLLAIGLGVWLARKITQPLVELRRIADRVSSGDITVTARDLTTQATDEVGDLTRAFGRMLTSMRLLAELTQADAAQQGSRRLHHSAPAPDHVIAAS